MAERNAEHESPGEHRRRRGSHWYHLLGLASFGGLRKEGEAALSSSRIKHTVEAVLDGSVETEVALALEQARLFVLSVDALTVPMHLTHGIDLRGADVATAVEIWREGNEDAYQSFRDSTSALSESSANYGADALLDYCRLVYVIQNSLADHIRRRFSDSA